VPTGHRGVITTGGAIKGIEAEGFTWVWPWQSLNIFNVRAEAVQVDSAEGATSDTQPVHVTLTVRYNVLPDKVAVVFEQYSKDGNLDRYVDTASRETFKAVTAKYSAPDLIAKRETVSRDILTLLRSKVDQFGTAIISVDVTSFVFGKEYMAAIIAKVQQDQLLQAAEKKTLTVIAEQKQNIAVAEAAATSAKVKADGEAYAVKVAAQAQAEALRIQNAALRENKDVLELRRIEVELEKAQRWNGALPTAIYSGAPIPFLNVK
jgi:regulator of protease activity HflC (stomatin/prohibitin superfamily)